MPRSRSSRHATGSAAVSSRSRLADGRLVQLGGEVVGNGHTAYLGLVGRAGPHPGAVVRRRARRDHPPGAGVARRGGVAVVVHRRRPRVLRRGREGAHRGRRGHRPGRPVIVPRAAPARPAQRRGLAARGRRHAGRAAAQGARPARPRRRVGRAHQPVRVRPQDRGRRRQRLLRLRAVGEPPGGRGVGHRRAADGRRPRRRTAVDGGRLDRRRPRRGPRHHGDR